MFALDAAAGRWEVRIGLPGGRHVYLGLHATEPEAARIYDRALVLLAGPAAATNFPTSNYATEMELFVKCGIFALLSLLGLCSCWNVSH